MKKLSSMLALSLALVMVLGMTAFAAGSPDTEVKAKSGTITNVKQGTTQINLDAAKAETDTLGVPEGAAAGATADLVGAFELEGTPDGDKVELEFTGLNFDEFVYIAMHLDESTQEWTRHEVTKVDANTIMISGLTTLSPFVIYGYSIRLTSDGGNTTPTTPGTTTTTNSAATTTTPLSPKTGETVPVAALIALLAMVGAAVVGTKKVIAER